jgi:endonuclease/exonuclease/phosphatase family metal-dependent hydrolase
MISTYLFPFHNSFGPFARYARIIIFVFISQFSVTNILAQATQDTIRVMTYNILKYSGSERNEYLNMVVSGVDPELICVQEIRSQDAVDIFASSVLENRYQTIRFNDGPDTDNHIFFKEDALVFVNARYLSTSLRDIAEYEMRVQSNDETLYIYSLHLKASKGSDNEQKRLAEVTILREELDAHTPGTNFIVLGDFNIYSSNEPAYQKLVLEGTTVSGQSFDPIDQPGDWNNNSTFEAIHSQSTRAEQLSDGGATGGLDDRFDQILISNPLWDNVTVSSYTAFGNDGNHFNQSINAGINTAVGAEMADALYLASDHLPVYCDFVFETATAVFTDNNVHHPELVLYQNYPNPFNPVTHIQFDISSRQHVELSIFNIRGEIINKLISGNLAAGNHIFSFNAENLPSGIYFYQLISGEYRMVKKMMLVR